MNCLKNRFFVALMILLLTTVVFQKSEAGEINSEIAKKTAISWFINSTAFNKLALEKGVIYSVIEPENNTGGIFEIKDSENKADMNIAIPADQRTIAGLCQLHSWSHSHPFISISKSSQSTRPSVGSKSAPSHQSFKELQSVSSQ